jgi:hypothetical protein
MLKRIAICVVSIGLVGASEALSQSERPAGSVVPGTQITSFTTVAGDRGTEEELPDAPSTAVASQTGRIASSTRVTVLNPSASAPNFAASAPSFVLVYEKVPQKKESDDFLSRLLEPSRSREHQRYRASLRESLMGRATDAVSSILVTRDESGRRRLNTSYFVAVLTSVAAHRAERPYWLRSSAAAPLGDFGSTVGNDAGMNLLHEFGPGLRQAVTGHMPTFMFRIEHRIIRERTPLTSVSKPSR